MFAAPPVPDGALGDGVDAVRVELACPHASFPTRNGTDCGVIRPSRCTQPTGDLIRSTGLMRWIPDSKPNLWIMVPSAPDAGYVVDFRSRGADLTAGF